MSEYGSVTLINPNSKHIFGGAYLDIWSGYDFKFVTFNKSPCQKTGKTHYKIVVKDKYERAWSSKPLTKENFSEIYWQLIRRGWRVVK